MADDVEHGGVGEHLAVGEAQFVEGVKVGDQFLHGGISNLVGSG